MKTHNGSTVWGQCLGILGYSCPLPRTHGQALRRMLRVETLCPTCLTVIKLTPLTRHNVVFSVALACYATCYHIVTSQIA